MSMLNKRRILQRAKLNNKAMTLIEVLVAMAILTVVVTPTLRMFASSFGTNLRSRLNQRAITIGESVMETFKAYPVEQMCLQFQNSTYKFAEGTTAGTTTVSAKFTDGTTGSPLRDDDTLKSKQQIQEIDFSMTGAKMDRSKYDIDITVTPHLDGASTPAVMKFESPNAFTDGFIVLAEDSIENSQDPSTGTAVNISTDVVNGFKAKVKANFLASHSTYTYVIDDIKLKDVKRTIEVSITDNGASQTVTEKITYTCSGASVKYSYSGTNPSTHAFVTGTGGPEDVTLTGDDGKYEVIFLNADGSTTDSFVVYDNSATIAGGNRNHRAGKLDNLYIYYFPMYEDIFGTGAEDHISITASLTSLYAGNGSDASIAAGTEPLNLFIVRQYSTKLTESQLGDQESRYNFTVDGTRSGDGKIKLWHNFGVPLKDGMSVAAVAAHITPAGESALFSSLGTLDQAVIRNTGLIYDITVDVYQADTTPAKSKLLTQYTGTINE